MATDPASAILRPTRPPFWNNATFRGIFYQVLFVAIVVAAGIFLVHNTLVNLNRQNIATGFGFLDREAGFGIGETLIPPLLITSFRREWKTNRPSESR